MNDLQRVDTPTKPHSSPAEWYSLSYSKKPLSRVSQTLSLKSENTGWEVGIYYSINRTKILHA